MAEQKKPRYFLWAIMILLCVGLLGFGTGGLGNNIRSIGSVGDKDLSVNAYQNALNQQIRAFEAQIGTRVSFPEAQSFGLVNAAQAQLISSRALDNEATEIGISVGDERVRQEVLRVPAFRGLDGNFDRETYRQALQRNGLTEADFETSIREDMARTLLQASVIGGVEAPDAYADALVQFIGEQRSFTWADVTEDDLTAPIPGPTDADLQTFYDENPELFTLPEAREITYAWLTPNMIQDSLSVDETALRELYDSRVEEFVRPERRLVERLAFVDPAAAEAAKQRIDAGELDFDALVAERGLDLADIDLGDVTIDELGAAGEAVFGANPGDVVGPINSTIGPALFRMNAVLAAEEATFEDVRPQLEEELSADRARRVIDASSEGINDLLAGGATLEDLEAETDMELGTISVTPETRDGIAAYEAFRSAAATVEEGDFPVLDNLADGGIFSLRLDGVTPPTLQPFDDVRDEVTTAWNAQRKQQAIMERAEEIAATIEPLADFTAIGLDAMAENNLTRRSFVEGTPPGFMVDVFDMDIATTRVIENTNGAIIVRLDGILPPDVDHPAVAAEREQILASTAAGIAQDVFEAYGNEVQSRTDIQLDQNIINAIHAQFQ